MKPERDMGVGGCSPGFEEVLPLAKAVSSLESFADRRLTRGCEAKPLVRKHCCPDKPDTDISGGTGVK